MVRIRLGRYEAEQGHLPPLCMQCGAPATLFKPRRFLWRRFRLRTSFDSLVDPLKRATVVVPLCQKHYKAWRRWQVLARLGCLGALILGVLSIALILCLRAWQPGAAWVEALARSLGGTLLLSLIALFVILRATQPIRSVEITTESITLSGVSEEFARAVEAGAKRHPRPT
jgi:hypothetical protein